MKRFFIVIALVWFTIPFTVSAAFRWPWQQPAKQAPAAPQVVIDSQALKTGNGKVDQWERITVGKNVRIGEKFSAEFSAAELQAIVRDELNRAKDSIVAPESFTVVVAENKLTVSATIVRPMRFGVRVVTGANVTGGKLLPEIINARVGVFSIGGHIVERLANQALGSTWREEMNPPTFAWDEVTMSEGKVYVAGHTVKPAAKVK